MSGKAWSVASLVATHKRIGVDADVLIYLVDAVEPWAAHSAAIVDAIDEGQVRASMSALAVAEVLAGPARSGDAASFERTAAELQDLQIEVVPLTRQLAEDAAWLRGRGAAHLVDAIHLATARSGATAFVTNDRRVRSLPSLEVLHLDDLDLEKPTEPPGR